MSTFNIIALVIAGLFIVALAIAMLAGITPISLKLHKAVFQTSGVALKGYDVVSYFEEGPIKGDQKFSYTWKKTNWFFASENHLNAFKKQPEKYIPQFGGYCTKAVSTGFVAPANPEFWTIHHDKLYIFSSEDVQDEFEKDPDSIIGACSKKWND
jgi:YHS domain-containing protein